MALLLKRPRTSQPLTPTGVDRGNPLATGIVGLYMPAVTNLDLSGFGAPLAVVSPGTRLLNATITPAGLGNYLPSSVDVFTETSAATVEQQRSPEATVLWFGTRLGTPPASNPPGLFGTLVPYNGTNTAPFVGANITVGSTGALTYAWNQAGTYRSIASGTLAANETAQLALTVKSGQAKAFKNGFQVGSTSTLASTISYGSTSGIGFDLHAFSTASECSHVLGVYWSRALSDEEILFLSADPWVLFKPRRIWVPVSVATGGNQTVNPGKGALAFTGRTPTVSQTVVTTVNPGKGSLTLVGYQPTVNRTANQTVAPGKGSLTLAGKTPSISQPSAVAPGKGSLVLTGRTPTVSQSVVTTVAPGKGALTLVGKTPTVTRTANQTVAPGKGTLTLVGKTPTVSVPGAAVYPDPANVALGVQYGPNGNDYTGTMAASSITAFFRRR